MSYSNSLPTNNTKNTTPISFFEKRKLEKEAKQKAYNEKKGHWLFSFFQKFHNPDAEANIKVSMRPDNGFNPKNVHHYINPEPSREEQLVAKRERGESLKSSEQLIVENYLRKKAEAIKNDFKAIETQKFNASPQTREGRLKLLLNTLALKIQKKEPLFVANIYLRLQEDDFKLTADLAVEYDNYLKQMEEIVSSLDMVELQFTKFHSQMPPLNQTGFKKFDEWQVKVIGNIDNGISTVVNAPTSAGKSVLSAYTTTKGRVLFVVPTDALAWQMSAYIGYVIGSAVPILTATYQSNPARDGMIELLNRSDAIVGTPETIVDFLPFIHNTFKWIVFDEIHMIGKPEGSAMEHIAKIFPNVPVLALSATIGNTDELVNWFNQLYPQKTVTQVICDKRFFNLQRFYYDGESNSLVSLNPLALVSESQIEDGSILNKSLQPTPPNTWDLAMKIFNLMEMGELEPHKYFDGIARIELDQANAYFYKLVKLLVDRYQTDKSAVMEIINSYKHESLSSSSIDLIKLAFTLKKEQKTPAIIFQKNTLACLRMAREFAKNMEELEQTTYPKLRAERIKLAKAARRLDKKNKVEKSSETDSKKSGSSRKEMKELVGVKTGKKKREGESYQDQHIGPVKKESINVVSEQEPHPDFILNRDQYFTEGMIESWVYDLKKYFPNTGDTYHYMIKLLWRGVGVYAKGLPDPYLRLVQTLACQKQLAVVFSDQSLVFGVSMPFRTVVIIRDEKLEDDLEPMMFHQMSGRAGRRGLDKEGNVVFAGYSWDRIKELSISEPPIVSGSSDTIYTIPHANQISKLFDTKQDWTSTSKNFLDKSVSEEDCEEFIQGITSNYSGGWSFGFIPDNVNHLHMNWKMRYTDECLLASLLIPYLRRAFEGKDHTQENNQVQLAHFLCRFISTSPTKNPVHALEDPAILVDNPYNQILEQLEELQIELPKMIDNRLFQSIQLNSIVKLQSEDATDELRHRLLEFGEKIKHIQHFCFHSDIIGLSRIMGKLLTRIWWIYHTSSPIMKSINQYETEDFKNIDEIEDSDEASEGEDSDEEGESKYESSSEDDDSDEEY
jgi:hypothetical protein